MKATAFCTTFVKRIKAQYSSDRSGTRPNEELLRYCGLSTAKELA